ncbi:MAG: hypothetical protein M1823_001567 [Watsoniomyces obsoletus]|nr:MAG: hypothetical protein M1823_001567 [Watsoniomyces obsoletus]
MEDSSGHTPMDIDQEPQQQSTQQPNVGSGNHETVPNDQPQSTVTKEQWHAMLAVVTNIVAYRDEDGNIRSKVFQRKVQERHFPDYYAVIHEPVFISSIKSRIVGKEYLNFEQFVRDLALMLHNTRVYNRPEAGAYQDAVKLMPVVEAELQKLVDEKIISAEVATLPDFGPIPSPSPLPEEELKDEDDDEQDEDDDEDDDDDDDEEEEDEPESDDEGGKRRKRRGPRSKTAIRKREGGARKSSTAKEALESARKTRSRPPRVDTPLEARIKNVLKGLRRFKDDNDELKITNFEKLPDRVAYPEYYTEIQNPIALDQIKRKAKRKKYMSLDELMQDVELMFENAKSYNREDSQIYKDAVELQKGARLLLIAERDEPDSAYGGGRVPLPDGIVHGGETWRIGDWVLLRNRNEGGEPIPAMIYRAWEDEAGQTWFNACWYYRPQWTVHRFDKHFYKDEVVKTGQYRDHQPDDLVGRCFIMFITRYHRCRPAMLPPGAPVFVCETRYNEELCRFGKIKTWASVFPDEVRDRDYDTVPLPSDAIKQKKVPTPIAHLLPENASADDPLPKPVVGDPDAPPVIGAVHKRPRAANESPPPSPTPPPPPSLPTPPPQHVSHSVSLPGLHGPSPTRNQPTTSARGGGMLPQSPYASQQSPYGPSSTTPAPSMQHAEVGTITSRSRARPRAGQSETTTSRTRSRPTRQAVAAVQQTPSVMGPPKEGIYFGTRGAAVSSPGAALRTTTGVPSTTAPTTNKLARNKFDDEVWHVTKEVEQQLPEQIRQLLRRDVDGRVPLFKNPPRNIDGSIPQTIEQQGMSSVGTNTPGLQNVGTGEDVRHSAKWLEAQANKKRQQGIALASTTSEQVATAAQVKATRVKAKQSKAARRLQRGKRIKTSAQAQATEERGAVTKKQKTSHISTAGIEPLLAGISFEALPGMTVMMSLIQSGNDKISNKVVKETDKKILEGYMTSSLDVNSEDLKTVHDVAEKELQAEMEAKAAQEAKELQERIRKYLPFSKMARKGWKPVKRTAHWMDD